MIERSDGFSPRQGSDGSMRFNRWMALPVGGVLALAIGVAAVSAAPSPSPSASASGKNYAQVFVDKLAGILHLTPAQTSNDLKSAELATIDQMVQDGRITKAQGDAPRRRQGSPRQGRQGGDDHPAAGGHASRPAGLDALQLRLRPSWLPWTGRPGRADRAGDLLRRVS